MDREPIYRNWSAKRWAAAIAAPLFVAAAIMMLVLADDLVGRLLATAFLLIFSGCAAMIYVDSRTAKGVMVILFMVLVIGLGCGSLAAAAYLDGPHWEGVVLGGLGFGGCLAGFLTGLLWPRRRHRGGAERRTAR